MNLILTIIRKILLIGTGIAVAVLTFPAATAVAAAPVIVLDGDFSDWTGQMYITDPTGDAAIHHRDITAFYWANNPDDETCYWMLERVPASSTVRYAVLIDTNNNGIFNEHDDRLVQVVYNPRGQDSRVKMIVRYGDTGQKISSVYNQDWGESINEGGRKVEFSVSFDDLGMGIGQTIRMYAIAYRIIPMLGFVNNMDLQDLEDFVDDLELDDVEEYLDEEEQADFEAFLNYLQSIDLEDFLNNQGLEGLEEFIMGIIGNHVIDRVPDSGDVQWSPVSILGYPMLIGVMVVAVVGIWYFKGRKWWNSRR